MLAALPILALVLGGMALAKRRHKPMAVHWIEDRAANEVQTVRRIGKLIYYATIETSPHFGETERKTYRIEVADAKNPHVAIAWTHPFPVYAYGNRELFPGPVIALRGTALYVAEPYRRQGIASQMYRFAEEAFVLPLVPSDTHSPMGRAFWESKKHKGLTPEQSKLDQALRRAEVSVDAYDQEVMQALQRVLKELE